MSGSSPLPPPSPPPARQAEDSLRALARAHRVQVAHRDALGEHVFNWFLRNKRAEWSRYQSHVSRYELETYLPIL